MHVDAADESFFLTVAVVINPCHPRILPRVVPAVAGPGHATVDVADRDPAAPNRILLPDGRHLFMTQPKASPACSVVQPHMKSLPGGPKKPGPAASAGSMMAARCCHPLPSSDSTRHTPPLCAPSKHTACKVRQCACNRGDIPSLDGSQLEGVHLFAARIPAFTWASASVTLTTAIPVPAMTCMQCQHCTACSLRHCVRLHRGVCLRPLQSP